MGIEEAKNKVFTSQPFEVTAEGILGYSKGTSETRKAHADPKSPVAPAMFAACFVIPATGSVLFEGDLGFDLSRIVHGGIEMGFDRLLKPGDKVTTESKFLGVEEKSTGNLINISFLCKDGAGKTVVEGITRYFVRGKKRKDAPEAAEPPPPQHPKAILSRTEAVAKDQSLLYADGSGDRFPIHTDDNFAKSVGLPGIILHGMCTLAFAARALVDGAAGGDPAKLKRIGVKFAKIVLPGDTLTTEAWETGKKGSNRALGYEMKNQKGDVVLAEGIAEIA